MKLKREDLVLSIFMLFGLFYPVFVSFLILYEDARQRVLEYENLKSFYRFYIGLEKCSKERAFELVELASDELSSTIGGAEGLFRLCSQNAGKFSFLSERFSEGKLEVKLKEGVLVLLFESSGGSLKIKFVGYDKGN